MPVSTASRTALRALWGRSVTGTISLKLLLVLVAFCRREISQHARATAGPVEQPHAAGCSGITGKPMGLSEVSQCRLTETG